MLLNDPNQQSTQVKEDEIDLLALVKLLWQYKWTLVSTTVLGAVVSVLFALAQPNIYQASALLEPLTDADNNQLSGLAQTLGTFTGTSLDQTPISQTKITIATMKSRRFIIDFINEHNIVIPLFTVKGWERETNKVIRDEKIYDFANSRWLRERGKPSDWEAYEKFFDQLSVSESNLNGLVTVGFEFPVPETARQWVTWLVKDINRQFRENEIVSTEASIRYLGEQLENTSISDIREVLYQLIQEQIKRSLLAETRPEFALKVIDPAIAPEKRVRPNRVLIAFLGTILSGFIGLIAVFVSHARRKHLEE